MDSTKKEFFNLFLNWFAKPSQIKSLQKQKLLQFLTFVREKSPFYKKLYSKVLQNDLSLLPVVNKQQLMEHLDDVFTDNTIKRKDIEGFLSRPETIGALFRNKYLIVKTTGTSGKSGTFVIDELTRKLGNSIMRIRGGLLSWYGPMKVFKFLLSGRRYALIDTANGPYAGYELFESERREDPNIEKSMCFINVMDSLEQQVKKLNAFQPKALGGYQSTFLRLAKEQEAGRLHIKPIFFIYTGEIVTKANREFIEKTFGCQGYVEYGATEYGAAIAVECKNNWLHYSADWFILEPVDKQYQPVAPGVPSDTVLITGLMNRVMPLIRYDQGDRIIVKPDVCSCGNKYPAIRILGRTSDLLEFPQKNEHGIGKILPFDLITEIERIPHVFFIQFIQDKRNSLEIRYQTIEGNDRTKLNSQIFKVMQDFLESKNIGKIHITISDALPMQNQKSGKYQIFVKKI